MRRAISSPCRYVSFSRTEYRGRFSDRKCLTLTGVAARNEKLRYTSDFEAAARFQERAVTQTLAYHPARFPAVPIQ